MVERDGVLTTKASNAIVCDNGRDREGVKFTGMGARLGTPGRRKPFVSDLSLRSYVEARRNLTSDDTENTLKLQPSRSIGE